MEEMPSNQGHAKFGSFVDKIPGAGLGNPGDMELHNVGCTSPDAARVSIKARTQLPSQVAMYDSTMVGSNRRDVGFSDNGSLPDEHSLASALEDLTLRFKDCAANSPTNPRNVVSKGHCLSGLVKSTSGLTSEDVTLNSPLLPSVAQDDSIGPQINGTEYMKQRPDELTGEYQEQPHSSSLYLGNLPINSGMHNLNNISNVPYKPSAISASPFQQQFYIDGQSRTYAPYQQVGSNYAWQHDIDAQRYSAMQPQYVYQQMPQVSGSDVHRMQSNQHASIRSSAKNAVSPYLGTASVHQLGQGSADPYWNSAVIQNGNNRHNGTFVNNYPCTFYPDCSCGNGDFCRLQQAEKIAHSYELNCLTKGSLQHQMLDKLSMRTSPEKILMRSEGANSVRNIKFGPAINGCAEVNQRINGYGQNHLLDVQSNGSLCFDRQNSQFLSSLKSEYDLSLKSPQPKYNSVDEVAGRIYILAKDQNGCRFLQRIFTEGTKEDVEKVFAEIIDHIGELMIDPFGNYLVQKLLEECNDDQRMHIIYEITKVPGELITVSCNMHGTRAVQKVIETLRTSDEVSMVVSALSPGAMRLMTDANGSHVAHRCLQKLLPEYKAFLLDTAILRYFQLAKDRQGCCIIQKCIDHSNEEQNFSLLRNITSSARSLAEDQYGNYVIQYCLNLNIPWVTAKIFNALEGHYGYLSMQKCSSHVIEHCVRIAPEPERMRIINEFVNDPKLLHIMLDQYGNYVIQTVIKECKGALHAALIGAIKPHAAALQSNMYGKRVLSRTYLKNKQY